MGCSGRSTQMIPVTKSQSSRAALKAKECAAQYWKGVPNKAVSIYFGLCLALTEQLLFTGLLFRLCMSSISNTPVNQLAAAETHQVVLPALGGVFRVPLLVRRPHWRIYVGRVSIAVVAGVISPAPTSSSDSGELKAKTTGRTETRSLETNSLISNEMEEKIITRSCDNETRTHTHTLQALEFSDELTFH